VPNETYSGYLPAICWIIFYYLNDLPLAYQMGWV